MTTRERWAQLVAAGGWYRPPKDEIGSFNEPYEHLVVIRALQPRLHAETIVYSNGRAAQHITRVENPAGYAAAFFSVMMECR